jgi:hypothetical protein
MHLQSKWWFETRYIGFVGDQTVLVDIQEMQPWLIFSTV